MQAARNILVFVFVLTSLSTNAHMVKTPAGGILFTGKQIPEQQDLYFAESFMNQNQFKTSNFMAIDEYVRAVSRAPLAVNGDDYIYVAKIFCRIKNVKGFFDKKDFLTLAYQKRAMPTINLSMVSQEPLNLNAEANLYGLISLTAPIQPQYYDEDDIKNNVNQVDLLMGITPIELSPKAITVRMTGNFNQYLSRLVMVSSFSELPEGQLLASTHVAVSIRHGLITNSQIFKNYLSQFFKETMVKGMEALSL